LQEVSAAMLAADAHAAVVVHDERLVGVITADEIAAAIGGDVTRLTAADILRPEQVLARADESVVEVHRRMREAGQQIAGVVDTRGRLVGVVVAE
jgi:CBS domain-containing protein